VSVGLYLDDDTGIRDLIRQAAALGETVVRSDDLGARGREDVAHLRLAASNALVLVTCNRRDFLPLHWRFLETGEPHAGIMVVSQGLPKGERIRVLLEFCQIATPADMANRLESLDDWR
jgi:hypothetical protein